MSEAQFDSLETIQIPFSIDQTQYVLLEPNGEAGIAYNKQRLASVKLFNRETKQVDITEDLLSDLLDIEPRILSLCCYHASITVVSGRQVIQLGERVTEAEIRSKWPYRKIKELYTKMKEIGELDKDGGENPTQEPTVGQSL